MLGIEPSSSARAARTLTIGKSLCSKPLALRAGEITSLIQKWTCDVMLASEVCEKKNGLDRASRRSVLRESTHSWYRSFVSAIFLSQWQNHLRTLPQRRRGGFLAFGQLFPGLGEEDQQVENMRKKSCSPTWRPPCRETSTV